MLMFDLTTLTDKQKDELKKYLARRENENTRGYFETALLLLWGAIKMSLLAFISVVMYLGVWAGTVVVWAGICVVVGAALVAFDFVVITVFLVLAGCIVALLPAIVIVIPSIIVSAINKVQYEQMVIERDIKKRVEKGQGAS